MSNLAFGNTREGYENYKKENPDSDVHYAGKVSLRKVQDRVSGRTIGYITETKLSDTPHIDEAEKHTRFLQVGIAGEWPGVRL